MKKKAVFTIVACSIAALILTGVLAVGLSSDGFGLGKLLRGEEGVPGEGAFRYEYTWDPAKWEVACLDVEWINGSVELKVVDGGMIRVTERSGRELKENEKLELTASGSTLNIKWKRQLLPFFLFQNQYKDLTVEIPREVAESLEELACDNVSGKTSASGFTAEELEFTTTSGDIEVSKLKGEQGEFSSTSGNIFVEGLEISGELAANTTSGGVEFSGVKTERLHMNTVSGKMMFRGRAEELDANSVSASVRGELENCPDKVDMDSVSGSLILSIPENEGFEVEYDSISGNFQSDFQMTGSSGGKSGRGLYSSGKSSFSFSTTSGDMRVLKNKAG